MFKYIETYCAKQLNTLLKTASAIHSYVNIRKHMTAYLSKDRKSTFGQA